MWALFWLTCSFGCQNASDLVRSSSANGVLSHKLPNVEVAGWHVGTCDETVMSTDVERWDGPNRLLVNFSAVLIRSQIQSPIL